MSGSVKIILHQHDVMATNKSHVLLIKQKQKLVQYIVKDIATNSYPCISACYWSNTACYYMVQILIAEVW